MLNIQIPTELLVILFMLGIILQVYAIWSRPIKYYFSTIGAFLIIVCAFNDRDIVLILTQLIVLYIFWKIKK